MRIITDIVRGRPHPKREVKKQSKMDSWIPMLILSPAILMSAFCIHGIFTILASIFNHK